MSKIKVKIISTLEQVFEIDWEEHTVQLIENKILQSNLLNQDNKNIGKKITYKFGPTELRYGIISFGKKHPFASLYKPRETIRVTIDGKPSIAKWHSAQVRLDGLTQLFSKCTNINDTEFEVEYLSTENTLCFKAKEEF